MFNIWRKIDDTIQVQKCNEKNGSTYYSLSIRIEMVLPISFPSDYIVIVCYC